MEKGPTATNIAGRKIIPRKAMAVIEVLSTFAAWAILTFVRLSCCVMMV
jgi:hypothetical protein